MKFQILLFFVVFLFVTSVVAQPARYLLFNPEDLCKYKEGKTIFVGRVISIEMISKDALPEVLKKTSGQKIKYTVSVEKVFSGQINLKEIKEFFLVKELEPGFVVNDESFFIFEESQNDSKFFTGVNWSYPLNNLKWSYPLNNYSAGEKAIRLSRIEEITSPNYRYPSLFGIVLQTDTSPINRSLELSVLFGHEADIYKSFAGITIKAKSKKNGQVFRTKTNEKGIFTFNNLEEGDYDLSMVIPKGFEEEFRYNGIKNNNLVLVKKENCGNVGVKLKIRKIKKQN